MRSQVWVVGLVACLACRGGGDGDTGSTSSETAVPTDTGAVAVVVTEHGVVTCANPGDRALAPFDRRTSPSPRNSDLWIWAGGEMAGDFDGDGWIDVMTPHEFGVELYAALPGGGAFNQVGKQVLGGFDLSFGTGGSVVDYDADGDLDVYVTRFTGDPGPAGMTPYGEPYGKNRLLRNVGNGTFEDVTDDAGVDGCGLDVNTGVTGCFRTMSSSWGDVDGDGDLDLFVGNYGWVDESGVKQDEFLPAEPSFLYLNDGDGTFTDVSDRLPQQFRDGYTYAGGLFDLDDDGDLDLYTVNDFGNKWPNHVLLNRGDGTFDDDVLTNSTGLNLNTTGMGLGIGDLNGDSVMDLAMPYWNNNHLMLSSQIGWVDFGGGAKGYSVDAPQKVGWGAELADFDNDGDLDLIQQYGHVANENPVWANAVRQPDALYVNVGTATDPVFEDQGIAWGLADPGVTRGVVLADFNRDGWLDVGKRDLAGPNVVYLSRCGTEGWLTLHLEQPGTANLDAIGAKVEIEVAGQRQVRWVIAGGTGYGAGMPPELHFGIGDADVIDAITVRWPDGAVSRVEDVTARQQVTLTR